MVIGISLTATVKGGPEMTLTDPATTRPSQCLIGPAETTQPTYYLQYLLFCFFLL